MLHHLDIIRGRGQQVDHPGAGGWRLGRARLVHQGGAQNRRSREAFSPGLAALPSAPRLRPRPCSRRAPPPRECVTQIRYDATCALTHLVRGGHAQVLESHLLIPSAYFLGQFDTVNKRAVTMQPDEKGLVTAGNAFGPGR